MTIYFNNWFSSISNIIADMKKRHGDSINIIGSSHNQNHVMKDVVDSFFVEDWEGRCSFMEWLIPFLKEQKPDIFFVKKWVEEVLENRKEIEELGIIIAAEDLDVYRLTDDKAGTYKKLEGAIPIPEYLRSSDKDAISTFLGTHNACLKLNNGEGGESYKKIVRRPMFLNDIKNGRYNEITHEEIKALISHSLPSELYQFIFMEYLESPEISADCYMSNQGFICICRNKLGKTRAERIYHNKEISNMCEKIGKSMGFKYPFNVQFRKKAGTDENDFSNYMLLEVNPRISGGSYYQQLIGLNICDVCVCDIAGIKNGYNINDYTDFKECLASHVETAVLIER